jgi:Na+/H+ antiporter NhaC
MKRGLEKQFNKDVENYRKALFYHARINDWETFKAKAGRMFDYVEAIEYSELERRFFKNFYVILVMLIVIIVALFSINSGVTPELMRLKNAIVLVGLGMSSFEVYFYVDYKIYMKVKTVHYAERRERFIRNIESDFRSCVLQVEERKTA